MSTSTMTGSISSSLNDLKKPFTSLFNFAQKVLNDLFDAEVDSKTPMHIWKKNTILFLFTSVLHVTIIGIILFRMDMWNLYKHYAELTILIFVIFVIFKVLIIIYVFVSKGDGVGVDINNLVILKFFVYEILAIAFGIIILTLILGLSMLIIKYVSGNDIGMFLLYASILFMIVVTIIVSVIVILRLYKADSKMSELLKKILFYIPCFIRDSWGWVSARFSGVSIISIGVVIMVLLIQFILRPLYNMISDKIDEKYLLTGPVYTNNETVVEVPSVDNDLIGIEKPNYNHSITCWFWIMPQSLDGRTSYTKHANILTYGGRPLLQYNPKLDTLRVSYRSSSSKLEELFSMKAIPKQTWNQFVINSNRGTIDIFINGELVSSKQVVEDEFIPSNIVVGSKDGIEGGIRNVDYSTELADARGVKMSYYINSLIYRFE